jgi:TonB family protein
MAEPRAYGFGLNRDANIAFASAYIAVLVTIAAFGVIRFVAHPPPLKLPALVGQMAGRAVPVPADRAQAIPDPAFSHRIAFYPRVALLNHQQGIVRLRLLILRTGEVGDVAVIRSSGYPQLDAAALIGVGEWRYLPVIRRGQAEASEVDLSIRFHLAAG